MKEFYRGVHLMSSELARSNLVPSLIANVDRVKWDKTRLRYDEFAGFAFSPSTSLPSTPPVLPPRLSQVTKSSYTADEDFSAADQVTEELGEDGGAAASVTLATLAAIVKERASV